MPAAVGCIALLTAFLMKAAHRRRRLLRLRRQRLLPRAACRPPRRWNLPHDLRLAPGDRLAARPPRVRGATSRRTSSTSPPRCRCSPSSRASSARSRRTSARRALEGARRRRHRGERRGGVRAVPRASDGCQSERQTSFAILRRAAHALVVGRRGAPSAATARARPSAPAKGAPPTDCHVVVPQVPPRRPRRRRRRVAGGPTTPPPSAGRAGSAACGSAMGGWAKEKRTSKPEL